jgi:hypothetical protein
MTFRPGSSRGPREYQYELALDGQTYALAAVGMDGEPGTSDDVYPDLRLRRPAQRLPGTALAKRPRQGDQPGGRQCGAWQPGAVSLSRDPRSWAARHGRYARLRRLARPVHGRRHSAAPTRKERTHSLGSLSLADQSLKVVVPMDPVVPTAAQAAALETSVRRRRGTDRCGRASPAALCRRAPRGGRASRAFRTDSPSAACWCAQKQWSSARSSRRFAIQASRFGTARPEWRAAQGTARRAQREYAGHAHAGPRPAWEALDSPRRAFGSGPRAKAMASSDLGET